MPIEQLINSVIALATCGAAVFAAVAAKAARTQSDAAWQQVKLQRPRPVVIIEGSWSLEKDTGEPDGFLLRNLGSSPAFDIDISDIEGPFIRSVQYRERLITERIFAIPEKSEIRAVHHRLTPGSQLSIQAALNFLKTAGQSFAPNDETGDSFNHKLEILVSYSALDGRRFTTVAVIRFHLGLDARAWIVPVSSWLVTELE